MTLNSGNGRPCAACCSRRWPRVFWPAPHSAAPDRCEPLARRAPRSGDETRAASSSPCGCRGAARSRRSLLALSGVLLQPCSAIHSATPMFSGLRRRRRRRPARHDRRCAAIVVHRLVGALGAVGMVYLLHAAVHRAPADGVVLASACGALSACCSRSRLSRVRAWCSGFRGLDGGESLLSAGAAALAVTSRFWSPGRLTCSRGRAARPHRGACAGGLADAAVHRLRHTDRHRRGERRHGRLLGSLPHTPCV